MEVVGQPWDLGHDFALLGGLEGVCFLDDPARQVVSVPSAAKAASAVPRGLVVVHGA